MLNLFVSAPLLFSSEFCCFFSSLIRLLVSTLFSVIILVDESKWKEFNKAYYYVKKSFKITKWIKKFLKLILALLVVMIFTSPIYIYEWILESKVTNTWNYINYKEWNLTDEEISSNFYNLQALELEFWKQSLWDLKDGLVKNNNYLIFLYILEFLFIFWIFQMLLVSFYKRELLWEKKVELKNKAKSENKEIKLHYAWLVFEISNFFKHWDRMTTIFNSIILSKEPHRGVNIAYPLLGLY